MGAHGGEGSPAHAGIDRVSEDDLLERGYPVPPPTRG